jgi:hypothetical protein
MPSKYHTNVQEGIIAFGKDKPQCKRFREVYGSNEAILINHPKGKFRPLVHYPDAQFVTNRGKRIVFEILDSQALKEDLIIADITFACLSPSIARIVFIAPTEKDQDRVKRVVTTIVANLLRFASPKSRFKKEIRYAFILREEARTPEAVRLLLYTMQFKLLKRLMF